MKWISVEDRLPSEKGQIVVLINGDPIIGTAFEGLCICLTDNKVNFITHLGWCNDKRFAPVTHWMPLPEPPKG